MERIAIDQILSLHGKVAVITGGSAGIGEAITQRLHEAGATTIVADIDAPKGTLLVQDLNKQRPDSALFYQTDVSNMESVSSMVDTVIKTYGGIDILVNNAGIYPMRSLEQMTLDDFTRVIDVNLKGLFLCTKIVTEHMKKRGAGGKVINITSIDALHPSMIGLAHYDASKHGAWGFTKSSALELAQYDITVNAIAPGGIATPGAGMADGVVPDQVKPFLDRIPMHRFGDSDEIGKVALFLASELSSYMTGSQIVVDGGVLLH